MSFIRTGTCNRCAECCGYPRSTDGGQNNPWPPDWPQSIRNWTPEAINTHLPILQFSSDMVNEAFGNFTIKGKRCYWIWIIGKGLCTDITPYGDVSTYDQRCPLLADKVGGQAPCRLVGTNYEYVWRAMCEPVPPVRFNTQEQVDAWFVTCPSCSYEYIAE